MKKKLNIPAIQWVKRYQVPIIIASALVTACHKQGDTTAAAKIPTPVKIRQVQPLAGATHARYSGSIEPQTRVDLAFKVGGYVQYVAVTKDANGNSRKLQEGDFVKEGTVLAVVREADYEQKLSAAKAALSEALAGQKQAELDSDRTGKLLASNTVSKVEGEHMGARLEGANARVDSAKARVAEAQLMLGDCTLRAPMDGVLIKRSVENGSLVGPGTLGFVIADTKKVKVTFGAPDVLVEKLRIGSAITVTLEAVAGEFSAEISKISPAADMKSRVFDVQATIPNGNDQLKVGMIASLKILDAADAESGLVLPLTSVVRSPRDPRGFSVFVVEGDEGKEKARLRDVKLGDVFGNTVAVTDGLKVGEKAISMGATLVGDGDSVRIIP
jgi:multidrug efflux system membrane fusion protein